MLAEGLEVYCMKAKRGTLFVAAGSVVGVIAVRLIPAVFHAVF